MTQYKQSFSWWNLTDAPISDEALIEAGARLGYDGIEMPNRELWPLIRDSGLSIVSINGHQSIEAGFNRRGHHDRIEREIAGNLDLAVAWNIPLLICFSGNRDGLDDAAGAETTAEGLRRVAPLAEDAGVTLVLELLNSKVDHPDYQCDHTAWGVDVCRRVDSPNVKLLYDIYHMQIMEGDIIRTVQETVAFIGHYHTAGNPGRHELDGRQELNYRPIAEAIAATGYAGYIGHEFIPTRDPVEGLREARALFL
jgi:hydroxypyruvate isomerase